MGRGETPERILKAALELFNELGEPNVTTNRIADELGISPGNLHYHFRTKLSLIESLFGRFERRMLDLLAIPEPESPEIEDIWLFLHLVFENIVAHRFLYRDLSELCARSRSLHQRFRAILRLSMATAAEFCHGLARAGRMNANEQEVEGLVRNVVLVSTYWIAFDQVLESDGQPRPERAAWQVMSLISPYLEGAAREQLTALGQAYLE